MLTHDADIFFEILDFIRVIKVKNFSDLCKYAIDEPEWMDFILDHADLIAHLFEGRENNS